MGKANYIHDYNEKNVCNLAQNGTNKRQMAELMKVNFTRSSAVAERPRDAP